MRRLVIPSNQHQHARDEDLFLCTGISLVSNVLLSMHTDDKECCKYTMFNSQHRDLLHPGYKVSLF
jgi:hypothetical protein